MPARPAKAKSTRKAKPAAKATSKAAPGPASKSAKAGPPKAAPPKSASAKPAPSKVAPSRGASSQKPAKEAAPVTRRTSAELHFTETTIIRGDAVEHGEELPSGATHEIAGHDECGQPILKRKRFSIY